MEDRSSATGCYGWNGWSPRLSVVALTSPIEPSLTRTTYECLLGVTEICPCRRTPAPVHAPVAPRFQVGHPWRRSLSSNVSCLVCAPNCDGLKRTTFRVGMNSQPQSVLILWIALAGLVAASAQKARRVRRISSSLPPPQALYPECSRSAAA